MNADADTGLTLHTALLQGVELLENARITAPRLTAEVLLAHAVRCERSYLYAHYDRELREVEWIHYGRYLHERLAGKPTQYITGRQEFYGREFRVTPAVLIPRPETEHLVESALKRLEKGARIVDVGCGSGAIAISLALEMNNNIFGSDISTAALEVARENAQRLSAPVELVAGDLLAAFGPGSLDAVVSNPPYVPLKDLRNLQREVRDYEPPVALFGGDSGNEIYARLVEQAARVLKPGGLLGLELGFGSVDAVRDMVATEWQDVEIMDDLAGIPRVLTAAKL
jgi:release factor glutamine methyltransferase